MKVGNVISLLVSGEITNATASDDLTIRVKMGTITVGTFALPLGNVTNEHWHVETDFIVRSVGVSGQVAEHTHIEVDGNTVQTGNVDTVDTTVAENLTVTVQWNNAKAGNIITALIGWVEFKN